MQATPINNKGHAIANPHNLEKEPPVSTALKLKFWTEWPHQCRSTANGQYHSQGSSTRESYAVPGAKRCLDTPTAWHPRWQLLKPISWKSQGGGENSSYGATGSGISGGQPGACGDLCLLPQVEGTLQHPGEWRVLIPGRMLPALLSIHRGGHLIGQRSHRSMDFLPAMPPARRRPVYAQINGGRPRLGEDLAWPEAQIGRAPTPAVPGGADQDHHSGPGCWRTRLVTQLRPHRPELGFCHPGGLPPGPRAGETSRAAARIASTSNIGAGRCGQPGYVPPGLGEIPAAPQSTAVALTRHYGLNNRHHYFRYLYGGATLDLGGKERREAQPVANHKIIIGLIPHLQHMEIHHRYKTLSPCEQELLTRYHLKQADVCAFFQ